MKEKILFICGVLLFLISGAWGQFVTTSTSGDTLLHILEDGRVRVNGQVTDLSALLDLNNNSMGFLPPRMNTVQRNAISSPAEGLVIYNTDSKCIELYTGSAEGWVNTCESNQAPVANTVHFTGDMVSGSTLTGQYTYADAENDQEGGATFQWYRADTPSGSNQSAITGATSQTYNISAGEVGNYLAFGVTPGAVSGSSPGIEDMSLFSYQAVSLDPNNQVPVASQVDFSGTLIIGSVLTGSYVYSDNENDPEGNSQYQWYRADDASGTNMTAITGATSMTYTLQSEDAEKYLAFEITPVAQYGNSPGAPVLSPIRGAVLPLYANSCDGPFDYSGTITFITSTMQEYTYLDRNLGAHRRATSLSDRYAYGSLYQWGRPSDGHECITWDSAFNGTPNSGTTTTLASSDNPGHSDFILSTAAPYDWRSPQNPNLWQGVSGTNNPCPSDSRVPTQYELQKIFDSDPGSNENFVGTLKMTHAGTRDATSGDISGSGVAGYYWSSTTFNNNSRLLYISSRTHSSNSVYRATGASVRCILDGVW